MATRKRYGTRHGLDMPRMIPGGKPRNDPRQGQLTQKPNPPRTKGRKPTGTSKSTTRGSVAARKRK